MVGYLINERFTFVMFFFAELHDCTCIIVIFDWDNFQLVTARLGKHGKAMFGFKNVGYS